MRNLAPPGHLVELLPSVGVTAEGGMMSLRPDRPKQDTLQDTRLALTLSRLRKARRD